ncbi:MAG: MFS transporter [Gammaproteobacteria bacterium]|nr:MFS transporter [Gammaproteobacteria bacterium]
MPRGRSRAHSPPARPPLFTTRVIEGIGFTLAVVSLPPLVSAAASVRDRPLAMGLWGAFMPGGIGLMMLVSPPVLFAFGWRGQWTGVGWALVAIALVLWLTCRQGDGAGRRDSRDLRAIGAAVLKPGPLLLFGCFACYSAMYVPLTSFFTTILISQKQVALDVAAWIGAPVVASNIVGNMSAGWLVRRGTAPRRLLAVAFVVMGVAGCMVFLAPTPVWMKAAFGLAFSAFGGLIPGTLFILARASRRTPRRSRRCPGFCCRAPASGRRSARCW